jgi:TatD DNase family protein
MIDTHCHLTDPRLLDQIDAVMQRAQGAGVSGIMTIGTHPADWPGCVELCRKYANVRAAVGVHPNYCHEAELADLSRLPELLREPGVLALGEMGLDYFHKDAPRDRQGEFFRAQLALARDHDRPAIIHSRQATDDTLAALGEFPTVAAVFHCFTGTLAEAKKIIAAGHYVGFTGVVTYKNAPEVRASAAIVPADRILVETDAPYLSPEPMRRQKVNEPSLVMHTAAMVAQVRGIRVEELDRITTENARRLFRWSAAAG